MAGTRVQINPRVLSWAAERAGVDLHHRFPHFDDWLSGDKQPTLRQLEDFAKAVSVPFGYLFLPEPPEERSPIPHFRTLTSQPAQPPTPNLLETIYIMQRRQAWMRDYLIDHGHKPAPFVRSASARDDPGEVAQRIQKVLGIDANWAASQQTWTRALRLLQERAEDAGVLVFISSIVGNNTHRKLSVKEFRGFALVDEYAPLVFINGADRKAGQIFSFAHALAHIWIGRSASFDLRKLKPAADEMEEACHRIAAEFLGHEWPAIYLRGGHARRSGEKGGNFYAMQTLRVGRRFGEAVVDAVREGHLLHLEAYRLTGLYGRMFERYANGVLRGRQPDKKGLEEDSMPMQDIVTLRDGSRVRTQFGELGNALAELRDAVVRSDAPEGQKLFLVADINSIQSQLAKPNPNPAIVAAAWQEVEKAASLRGCAAAVERVSNLIGRVLL